MKKPNPVAKYQRQFNQAKVFVNKKKRQKSGYLKHTKHGENKNPLLAA